MVAKLRRASLLKHKMHKVSQIYFAGICKRVAVVYEKEIYEQTACCLITLNCLFHGQMARFVYAAHLEQELSARLEAKVAIWFVSFCAGSICAHWCACPVCPASVQPIGPRPSLRKLLESQIVIAPPTRRCWGEREVLCWPPWTSFHLTTLNRLGWWRTSLRDGVVQPGSWRQFSHSVNSDTVNRNVKLIDCLQKVLPGFVIILSCC